VKLLVKNLNRFFFSVSRKVTRRRGGKDHRLEPYRLGHGHGRVFDVEMIEVHYQDLPLHLNRHDVARGLVEAVLPFSFTPDCDAVCALFSASRKFHLQSVTLVM
jgi:hypothetical protein